MRTIYQAILIGLLSGSLACSTDSISPTDRRQSAEEEIDRLADEAALTMETTTDAPASLRSWCENLDPSASKEQLAEAIGDQAVAGYASLYLESPDNALEDAVASAMEKDPEFLNRAISTCGASLQEDPAIYRYLESVQAQILGDSSQGELDASFDLTASMIEYALLVALIAIICIAALHNLADSVQKQLEETADKI